MIRSHSRHRDPRRGAILIVVLALLALFAVIGLSFIYYADSEANVARAYREAQTREGGGIAPPDGQDALQKFLSVLVYDEAYSGASLLNSARGHSLARAMYGYMGGAERLNTVAFNGVGAFEDTTGLPPGVTSRKQLVNFALIGGTRFDPEWAGGPRGPTSPPTIGIDTYIGKNAGYTYPDANNFYLGAIDPRTGEVLVPSFHRDWIFGTLDPDPTNPNWTNTQGRFLTLRPRPADNKDAAGAEVFPYVPQNQDGTYTGDVQNLIGGVGVQRNDSLWMDIGLAPFRWNGKWIKPIIAPLIVSLDGRINLSAAGNIHNGSHQSHAGYGPWEINLFRLTPDAIVKTRYGPSPTPKSQNGLTNRLYNPNVGPLPQYAKVNWAMNIGAAFALPTGTSLTGIPTYTSYDDNTVAAPDHPSIFNPTEWPALPNTPPKTRTFLLSDARRLSLRYADRPESYDLMDIKPAAPSLVGNTPTAMFSRADAAHPLRMRFTTLSTGLDVPMLAPQTLDYTASTFQKPAPAGTNPDNQHPFPGGGIPAAVPQITPTSTAGTTSSDLDATNKLWINKLASLGGVNLNRKLVDYRPTAGQSKGLAPNNLQNQGLDAWADRHNLARDIFARLIIATGAAAQVDPANGNVTIPASVTASTAGSPNPQYEALRYLAQLAANIVDFIDDDDVSTTFVWNPVQDWSGGSGTPALAVVNTTILSTGTQFPGNFATANDIQTRVVFGTEKPRLVVNEAYSEVVNDPTDMFGDPMPAMGAPMGPMKSVHVRFWLELLNPTSTPYGGANLGPLGDGSVNILYEAADGATTSYSPYQILVVGNKGNKAMNVAQALRNPLNSRGDLAVGGPAATSDIKVDFTGWTTSLAGTPKRVIAPNKGTYRPTDTSVAILAPKVTAVNPLDPAVEWNPGTAINTNPNVVEAELTTGTVGSTATQGLAYLLDIPTETELNPNAGMPGLFMQSVQRHVIVLRRLANPYLPPNDPDTALTPGVPVNPYVTVDYMDYVPSFDAIVKAKDTGAGMGATAKRTYKGDIASANPANGYDPLNPPMAMGTDYQRTAVGRVQPYAGYVAENSPPTNTGTPAYPNQFLLFQNPSNNPGGAPKNTLGRHNGTTDTLPASGLPTTATETIVMPFDWLVHFDRPLGTPLELLHVSCRKPHELTQLFVPQGAPNANTPGHTARWTQPYTPGSSVSASNPTTGLHRAFELLRVKPWDLNTPMGGKVHGRVNINEQVDDKILEAVIDRQGSNGFQTTDVTTVTSRLLGSRSPSSSSVNLPNMTLVTRNTLASTIYDSPPGSDRPYHGNGVPQFSTGEGINDTLLRHQPGNSTPQAWVPGMDLNGTSHPYLQSEAARKMWHNITPVSNAFAVWVTIGFFEVDYATPADEGGGNMRYKLGKEVYREIPGDNRQQYFAIVDRTNLTLDPADVTKQGPRPGFTELVDNVQPGGTSPITITVKAVPDPNNLAIPVIFTDGVRAEAVKSTGPYPNPVPMLSVGSILYIGNGTPPSKTITPTPAVPTDGLNRPTNCEAVVVTKLVSFANGDAKLEVQPLPGTTTSTTLAHFHPAGTLVTNAMPGNPGPQTNFNYSSPTYQPVVREVTRIK